MNNDKIFEQIPPSNIDAELAVLGCLLLDPNSIKLLKKALPVQAFTLKAHQLIYRACLDIDNKGQICDFLSVCNFLSDQKLLDSSGGMTFLSKLLNSTVSATNLDRYIAIIADKYRRRKLIELGHKLTELGYDTSIDLADLEQKVNGLTSQWIGKDTPPASAARKIKISFSRSFTSANEKEKSELCLSSEADSISEVSDLVGDLVEEGLAFKLYPSEE